MPNESDAKPLDQGFRVKNMPVNICYILVFGLINDCCLCVEKKGLRENSRGESLSNSGPRVHALVLRYPNSGRYGGTTVCTVDTRLLFDGQTSKFKTSINGRTKAPMLLAVIII